MSLENTAPSSVARIKGTQEGMAGTWLPCQGAWTLHINESIEVNRGVTDPGLFLTYYSSDNVKNIHSGAGGRCGEIVEGPY